MAANVDAKQLKKLKDISDDLGIIRESTRPKQVFIRGLFQGVGIIVGSVIASQLFRNRLVL